MTAQEQFERLDEAWSHFADPKLYFYQIGPFPFCLSFATDSLIEPITRAFHHLQIDAIPSKPFTIRLWDTAKTTQKLPPLDWNLIYRNGYQGYGSPPIYLHYFDHIQALSLLDTEKNRAYFACQTAATLPWWVSGSPLQVILHAWLREKGVQLTHTAAISNGRTSVLLSGKGGSGKSTTTLACLMKGFHFIGEDYCALEPGRVPQVFSVYQSAKWSSYTRKLFPFYERSIANPQTADLEKALVYYEDLFPGQIKKSSSVRAILSLTIEKTDVPRIKKYNFHSTLKDLMMSTLKQLPFYHSSSMNILKTFTSQVALYQLVLSQNMDANVQAIQDIFSEIE